MTSWSRPVDHANIEIEHNGKRYVGAYSSDNVMVTVWYGGASTKALFHTNSPEALALLLLGELVAETRPD